MTARELLFSCMAAPKMIQLLCLEWYIFGYIIHFRSGAGNTGAVFMLFG